MAPPLLGRERAIADVAAAIETSHLVTLSGAPGIGKTSLARAIADRHPSGAAFVELAPITDHERVLTAVAAAVGVREPSAVDTIEAIGATLRRRQPLLVLDNCEHLLQPTTRLVSALLDACPRLRVLASSREPLGLDGERDWQVPPLAVPAFANIEPELLLEYPAIALFVARAREVRPEFALNSFLAADVVEICRRLEGVPLAIELAAARVAAMTPSEIVRRLEDRLSLLSKGGRSPISRHRTLSAALDWSYDLLTAPERALLRRLSVFADRFQLDAAATVCTGEQVDPPGVAALIGRLVAKSLVVAEPSVASDDPLRYRLLETIRAYATDKLEDAAEGAEMRTTHARFFVDLAERAEAELTGADQARWLDCLDAARADLRAAVEWLLSHGQEELALRLVSTLVLFWRVRGPFTEGRDMLSLALVASERASPLLRARTVWGVGFLTLMAGDRNGAIPHLERSLAASRAVGDARGAARSLLILADAQILDSGPSQLPLLDDSISLAREAGDSWCLAHALGVAGNECERRGDLRRARRMFDECLSVARSARDLQGLRFGLIGLGGVAISQGDYREAQSVLEEAAALTRALGEAYDHAIALGSLGKLAKERGDYARAKELFDQTLAALPNPAPWGAEATYAVHLATVYHAQGDRERARRLLEEVKTQSPQAGLLLAFASLARDDGEVDVARALLEEARDVARSERRHDLLATALHRLGEVARAAGDAEPATALHDEALALAHGMGADPKVADSLEAIAGLAAAAGHHRDAARLFGAAQALRDRIGCVRHPCDRARHKSDSDLIARSLSADDLAAAQAEGRGLRLADAVREASSTPIRRRANGWATLTERERDLAELVAEGLTNPEIAERLVIARETVKTHLSNIFTKLGISGRRELAREFRYRDSRSS